MTVLVTAASKHGTTVEIAQAVANQLNALDVPAVFVPLAQVVGVDDYEAVVIGSAVYTGHWMPATIAFVDQYAEALRERPVWLFSSGPIGDPPKPDETAIDVKSVVALTGAREHVAFAGRLDTHQFRFAERMLDRVVRAVEGDFRDWDAVTDWTAHIAGDFKAGLQIV